PSARTAATTIDTGGHTTNGRGSSTRTFTPSGSDRGPRFGDGPDGLLVTRPVAGLPGAKTITDGRAVSSGVAVAAQNPTPVPVAQRASNRSSTSSAPSPKAWPSARSGRVAPAQRREVLGSNPGLEP